uniref:BTB domain-containing protein n=2 Tax=Cacopsylla melanoneura TaxID=428564 RepID=A0A8D8VL94_9HEMI
MAAKQKAVYTNGLRALQKRMGAVFNNAKFSDTVFTVKNQKFYAFSQLVAMSSSTLDDLITVHFAHGVKEINLSNVKNAESFSVILQYMYGLDIDFAELRPAVICEILDLAHTYKLDEFNEDLKQYLSKIETFGIESLAALLNASKKFNLNDLYVKLTR